MSEKRKNKTEEELRAEVEKQTDEKFIQEFRELEKKHSRKIVAELYFAPNGIVPRLNVVTSKEEDPVPEKE